MNTLEELTSRARQRRRVLDGLAGEARSVLTRGKTIQTEVGQLTASISQFEKVTALLNSLGEDKQLEAQKVIEELVTWGLQTIFDSTLSFHITQTTKAKAAHVEFYVRDTFPNQPVKETPVMDARGGGLAAIIGFLLRIVVMLLGRKNSSDENILVLDETFAHVSAEYLDGLGEFLRQLVDRTGIQIVMVTHQPEFAEFADRVYRFSTTKGQTIVSEDS